MKNYTITEEQIKLLDDGMMPFIEVKEKLRIWFPEAFVQKLEIDKWYKAKFAKKTIIFFENIDEENNILGYGIDGTGKWYDSNIENNHYGSISDVQDWDIATDKEVEKALIKEAKKRGYTTYNTVSLTGNYSSELDFVKEEVNDNFNFHFDGEKLFSMPENEGGKILFMDGKWAEIKKEPIHLNYQQIADKFGVDADLIRISKI